MPKQQTLTKSQQSIEEYLIENGFSRVESDIFGQLLMRGKIVTDEKIFDTLIDIDKDVPVNYPKFYTIDSDMVFYQPHIERPHKLKSVGTLTGMCIVAENEKIFYNNPKELIHALLNRYEALCYDLANDRFEKKADFLKEFDSYWPKNKPDIYMHFNEPLKDKSMISLVLLNSSDTQIQVIVYDDFNDINNYTNSSKFNIVQKYMCPYIDIENNFVLPFPYTYKDLIRLFTKSGHMKFIKKLHSNQHIWEVLIIGIDMPNEQKHYVVVNLLDIKDEKFIKNKNNFQVFFSKRYEKIPFNGIHIKSIERRWLMQRGGNSNTKQISQKKFTIAILGCGSIGSNLAYKLCKSGVNNIILIDPSNLKSSNIGRHFLGMDCVGENKAIAMQKILQSQFIGINIKAYPESAQNCIDNFVDIDLIIGAIGSDEPSVEPYLANLIAQDKLPPMFSCWLEADAIAGHGFYTDKSIDVESFEQMTDNMNIINHDFASSLIQSEVGCNSDYMPYSHLSADDHINKMAKFILDIALNKQVMRAISSYGDVKQYESELLYKVQPNSIKYWSDNELEI